MMISVDGLDFAGKTTVAKKLSEILGFDYLKIKKGSSRDFSKLSGEQEVTFTIIEEMSELLPEGNIVLDRGYLSAITTGLIYDPNLDVESLISNLPKSLIPDFGIIVTSSLEEALNRSQIKRATKQDVIILGSEYEAHQEWMIKNCRHKFINIVNNYKKIEDLYVILEKTVQHILKGET